MNKFVSSVLVITFLLAIGVVLPTIIDTALAMRNCEVKACIAAGESPSACIEARK